MNRDAFERIAREALTEVLDEQGYQRENHEEVCNWIAWPPADLQDTAMTLWCAELADNKEDARASICRVCVYKNSGDDEAKREIKQQIYAYRITPPPHLDHEE